MQVRKAVIPVAGWGTRMLPAAKAIPKEMLPILDRPTIQHIVEEAAESGIDDVLLITSRHKQAIEEHFSRNCKLQNHLGAGAKASLLASIDELSAKVRISSAIQPRPRGLGDAVNHARFHVGREPFVCMLGDAVFTGRPSPTRQLLDAFEKLRTPIIGLEEVPIEKVSRYGIVAGEMIDDGLLRVTTLVEKPAQDQAPSRLAVAARYVLTPAIFDCLDRTVPGSGGEIQLTDALRLLLDSQPIHAVILKATRHDIGNPIDWLRTNLIFAAQRDDYWDKLAPTVRSLLADKKTY